MAVSHSDEFANLVRAFEARVAAAVRVGSTALGERLSCLACFRPTGENGLKFGGGVGVCRKGLLRISRIDSFLELFSRRLLP
mmetsp:Transcript_18443/g.26806  ORF Transcript_18443/g.26806 Transcript_18443/m.26806 type:complete len:82 (-) Transcript_18443:354-599(-)